MACWHVLKPWSAVSFSLEWDAVLLTLWSVLLLLALHRIMLRRVFDCDCRLTADGIALHAPSSVSYALRVCLTIMQDLALSRALAALAALRPDI